MKRGSWKSFFNALTLSAGSTSALRKTLKSESIVSDSIDADDPFYSLADLSDVSGESLTNEQIDDVLYGQ